MSAPDIDELARLWRQEPGPEEQAAFAAIARSTGRRAWMLDRFESATTILLALAILGYLVRYGNPTAVVIGLIIIVGIVWSTIRRHELMRRARAAVQGSPEKMLEEGVRTLGCTLRRHTIGTALLLPGFILGALLKYSLFTGGALAGFVPAIVEALGHINGRISFGIVFAALLYLLRANHRLRRELRRMTELRAEYLEEARLDAAA